MSFTRREFVQMSLAAGAYGSVFPNALNASSTLSEADLLSFEALGNVTLLHLTDLHAQLKPIYFREPSVNVGVGEVSGLPPHITGESFLKQFGVEAGSVDAYALSASDFTRLAAQYGRVGGLDRMATLVKAIRAERDGKTLLLDGGDTWQGSYTALESGGEDMVGAMKLLGVDAMTAHWEFTHGADQVNHLIEQLGFPFLAGNVVDKDWEEPVFQGSHIFERGGVAIAVIGQAFPYTPIANPGWMIPEWSFGIREQGVRDQVKAARDGGAELVVLLSHNGFDVDRKLAARVDGIDVILSGHTHDAVPVAVEVNKTLLVASGSHGKFLSRLDLDVSNGGIKDYRYRLIPVFADAITPDADMAAYIATTRAPHESMLSEVLGVTQSALYRRGNLNGTFDDLILAAIQEQRDAEIALSPGFRWGASLLPGQSITMDDVYNQTAITYPSVYRNNMSGAVIKEILEDVADNLFNPDPYYQQGGDMVRVGGLGYRLDPHAARGQRISELVRWPSGEPLDANKTYVVAGWASVNENVDGPPVSDLVADYIRQQGEINVQPNTAVRLA